MFSVPPSRSCVATSFCSPLTTAYYEYFDSSALSPIDSASDCVATSTASYVLDDDDLLDEHLYSIETTIDNSKVTSISGIYDSELDYSFDVNDVSFDEDDELRAAIIEACNQ
jgi:hypothetical protein